MPLISIDASKKQIEAVRTCRGEPEERQVLLCGPDGVGVCIWKDGSAYDSDVPNLTISSREAAQGFSPCYICNMFCLCEILNEGCPHCGLQETPQREALFEIPLRGCWGGVYRAVRVVCAYLRRCWFCGRNMYQSEEKGCNNQACEMPLVCSSMWFCCPYIFS